MTNSKRRIYISLLLLLLGLALLAYAQSPGKAILLNVQSAIGPATSDYIERGIKLGIDQGAPVIIIRLDTPGGLDKSMRSIIKAMLASSVPVAVYVAPSGARAASAGTFMIYASHVAAMAPGTNLGAASPVSIGGDFTSPGSIQDKKEKKGARDDTPASNQQTLKKKVTLDAIAYIRSLAQMRGRNVKFAEQAVRQAATLTAQEARQQNVVEIIAKDTADLLTQLHGRTVTVLGQPYVLKTANVAVHEVIPDWRSRFLAVITDPSVAYILMLIGIYGLFFEFANPGFVVPGVAGAIALVLALYAFQLLPINYAGLGLIFIGIIFMFMEAFVPSFGALGVGGIIAFIVGSVLLFDPNLVGYQVAWPLIFAMAIVNGGFFFFVIGMAVKARRRVVVSGREQLLGLSGKVLEDMQDDMGQARIRGEIWRIHSAAPLTRGTAIRVISVQGLVLNVEEIKIKE